jgi:hypothetical protein
MALVCGEVVVHAHLPRLDILHMPVHITAQVALWGRSPARLAPVLGKARKAGICIHFHPI